MKRIVCYCCILLLLFSVSACKKKQKPTQQPVASDITSKAEPTKAAAPTATLAPTNTPAPTATLAPTATPAPETAPTSAAISNEQLVNNMLALDSYYRSIRSITTGADGGTWEDYKEFAYAKNPFTEYILLDFVTDGTTNETLILGDIHYGRMNDEKWTKSLPGDWYTERPQEFRYELSTQHFPIDYGKLTLTPSGTENVNGVDCTKYELSGGYDDEYTDNDVKYRITLSGSGNVWISKDPVIKEVLIRQRITLNVDMQTVELKDKEGNPYRSNPQVSIEDDVTGINSTVMQPPPDSEIMTFGEQSSEFDETKADNIAVAEALPPGTVTQEQAEAWIGKGWETDYDRLIFEWVNGYLLGSWVWMDNTKMEAYLEDYLVGTIDGNMLKGNLMYLSEPGEFEFTLDASGQSFTGKGKLDNSADWFQWNGQVSE